MGGGFWNTGILAASASYALENLIPLISKDNEIANKLATELSKIEGITCNPANT